MSLRARITAATAVAVTATVLALSAVAYLSVRSHLIGEIDNSLANRAQVFLGPHGGDGGGGGFAGQGPGPGDARRFAAVPPSGSSDQTPPAPAFGGASGYFQFVYPDGTVARPPSESSGSALPVDSRVLAVARTGRGSFYTSEKVAGHHLRVLTTYDPYDQYAVQVALPLAEADRVLHGLLQTFALVIVGGLLLAALLGAVIGRAAVAPIRRFVQRTESVTGTLSLDERLEGGSAAELQRLAASFNRTLDALEQSVEAQRHLIADASHELRTPIAALRTNIQIFLEAERLGAEEHAAMRESIIAELDDLTQLVADVVELARGAEPAEHLETMRLDEVIESTLDRARRRAPELTFEVDLEPTMIENVPERVARAVTNLLDNARKWSPPGGTVEVALRDGTLAVRDHGPGFDEADLPHVFDRFYRAEKARRMPGSGLGLAIVRQAAEAHGGWVSAANAPDGGALLRASFGPPRAPAAEAVAPADHPVRA